MSSSSPTRARAAATATYRRTHPTTARGPRYGVLVSVAFHAAVVAAALFTFQRNFDMPEDSNVVPVDLVTIADVTNVAAQALPAPEPEKLDIPVPALEAPPEPQLQAVEPAPVPPVPKFDVKKDVKPAEKPVEPKKTAAVNFDALLNKLTCRKVHAIAGLTYPERGFARHRATNLNLLNLHLFELTGLLEADHVVLFDHHFIGDRIIDTDPADTTANRL